MLCGAVLKDWKPIQKPMAEVAPADAAILALLPGALAKRYKAPPIPKKERFDASNVLVKLLTANHFVHAHKVLEDGKHGVLRVYLKYHEGEPVIRHLERVSRPGRRHYVRAADIPRVRNGLGMAILSTSAGVLSDRGAREQGVGGELMALVW